MVSYSWKVEVGVLRCHGDAQAISHWFISSKLNQNAFYLKITWKLFSKWSSSCLHCKENFFWKKFFWLCSKRGESVQTALWELLGSNQWHLPCHDSALPTELSSHKAVWSEAFYINRFREQPELPFCSESSSDSLESFLETFRVTLAMLSYQSLKCPGQRFKILQNLLCTNDPGSSNLALRRAWAGFVWPPSSHQVSIPLPI